MLANTKQVRAIVNSLHIIEKGGWKNNWTDKSTTANMRRLCFMLKWEDRNTALRRVNEALFLAGFTNRVKITCSKRGRRCYLRVKAAFNG